jgi:hypothetical protein
MPSDTSQRLPTMTDYDLQHLRLLNLIEARRLNEFGFDDIQELKVLIGRDYIDLTEIPGQWPTISLNTEGQHYHQCLFELAIERMRRAGQPAPTHEAPIINAYEAVLRPASAL